MRILVWTVGQYWRPVVPSLVSHSVYSLHTPLQHTTPHHSALGANINTTTNNNINYKSPSTFGDMLFSVMGAAGTNVKWIIYRKSNGLITGRARRRWKDVERRQKMDTNYN